MTQGSSLRPGLICLMYHRVIDPAAWGKLASAEQIYAIGADRFEAQMWFLKERGYEFLTLEEAVEVIQGTRSLCGPSILITFDDGCQSVFDWAYPILRKLDLPAAVFVTTELTSAVFDVDGGRDERLTDEQIRELHTNRIGIGSHGVQHLPLSGLQDQELRAELDGSMRALEGVTGAKVNTLAIPGNWYDARVLGFAERSGYEAVWCSDPGIVRGARNPWGIPRVNVEGTSDLDAFAAAISPSMILQRRLILEAKKLPKRVVGPQRWLVFRRTVLARISGDLLSTTKLLKTARYLFVGILGILALALIRQLF